MKVSPIIWAIKDNTAVYRLSDNSLVSLTGKTITIDTGATRLRPNCTLVLARTASGLMDKYMVVQLISTANSGTIGTFKILSGTEFTSGNAQDVIAFATDSIFNINPANIHSNANNSSISTIFNASSTFADASTSEEGTISFGADFGSYTPLKGTLLFMTSWLSTGAFNGYCIAELLTTTTYRVLYGSNILLAAATGGVAIVLMDYPRFITADISALEVGEIGRITDTVYGDFSPVQNQLVLDGLMHNAFRASTFAYCRMDDNTLRIFRGMTSTDPVFMQTAQIHYSTK